MSDRPERDWLGGPRHPLAAAICLVGIAWAMAWAVRGCVEGATQADIAREKARAESSKAFWGQREK